MDKSTLHKDLLELSPQDFFMKHIVKSHNWYIADYLKTPSDQLIDKMDLLKEIVSKNFEIGFHSLQIVGSAKTGFSLSPYKILTPFHEANKDEKSSDIDIAIVSNAWYSRLWDNVREIRQLYYTSELYNRFTSSIFKGFINEKDICCLSSLRKKWQEKVAPVNQELQDKLAFVHPITYRIYRSWEDLEDYQINSIKRAQQKIEG